MQNIIIGFKHGFKTIFPGVSNLNIRILIIITIIVIMSDQYNIYKNKYIQNKFYNILNNKGNDKMTQITSIAS